MNFRIIFGLIAVLALTKNFGFGQNPDIQAVVDRVSGDSILKHIEVLQKFDRHALINDRRSTDYIVKYLKKYQFDTVYFQEMKFQWTIGGIDSLYTSLPNIIAVKKAKRNPDSIFILGAHYDAPWAFENLKGSEIPTSPGADDNASGTSGVLDAARVLSGFGFNKTLIIILFSAEEIGLQGSKYFVENLDRKNKIFAVVNLDMIAYQEKENPKVTISTSPISEDISNCVKNAISQYVDTLDYNISTFVHSDNLSFLDNDIPAVSLSDILTENNANPYIHTMADTIGVSVNSKNLAELITKTTVAAILELDNMNIPNSTSIHHPEGTEIKIFPNPVEEFVYIEVNDNNTGKTNIELLNICGEVIQSIITNSRECLINISYCPDGIYFIRANGNVQKLIKE